MSHILPYVTSVLWVMCVSLSWFHNCLTGRLRYFKISDISFCLKVLSSIPRGSFLPPYLFILLTGDTVVQLITQNTFFLGNIKLFVLSYKMIIADTVRCRVFEGSWVDNSIFLFYRQTAVINSSIKTEALFLHYKLDDSYIRTDFITDLTHSSTIH